MKRWFSRLHVQQKVVLVALVVTTAALFTGLLGLTAFDVYRHTARALDDATTLATVIAENSAAAVAFDDGEAARATLAAVRVRTAVTRACMRRPDGELVAEYVRSTEWQCAETRDQPDGFLVTGYTAPIVRNQQLWGSVYVELDSTGLAERIALTAAVSFLMLVVAVALAWALARRMTHTITRPLDELTAAVARAGEGVYAPAAIATYEDEVRDLVLAFNDMLGRVRISNEDLLRELQDRKRVQAQSEALLARERASNRSKDEFLAAVSHELRTPLTAILGWAQVLQVKRLDQAGLERAVASIARNARAQARVVDDLVDVARIATGKLHLRPEPLDARQPLDAAIEAIRPAAEARRIRIDTDVADATCMVIADRDRLRQVIWNLLSNAVKFSQPGGRVRVTLRDRGTECEITVSDTGTGIAPDLLPHVFERFMQADSSTTREHAGLGLGLAIARELMEMQGGSVTLTSDGPGRGATAVVRLPMISHGADVEEADPREPDADGPALAGIRILAVDDNHDTLEMMAMALAGLGARVRTADSGAAALQAWEAERPDVLLCDLAMPGMDGFALLREIRRRDAAATGVPAVAVTAHASVDYQRRSQQAGFVHHLVKPFRTAELVTVVREVMAA